MLQNVINLVNKTHIIVFKEGHACLGVVEIVITYGQNCLYAFSKVPLVCFFWIVKIVIWDCLDCL